MICNMARPLLLILATLSVFVIDISHAQLGSAWRVTFPENTHAIATACGVSRNNMPIPVALPSDLLTLDSRRTRVLVVVQAPRDSPIVAGIVKQWVTLRAESPDDSVQIGLVPSMYPAGLPARPSAYPPKGKAYGDPDDPEAGYLWRYIGNLAPDLVVVVRPNDEPQPGDETTWDWSPGTNAPHSLAGALNTNLVAGVGTVSAVSVVATTNSDIFADLKKTLAEGRVQLTGTAKVELRRRAKRSPIQIATELSSVYGHKLPSVAYIPSLALTGRMRLGELTDDPSHLRDVQEIVSPYLDGTKSSLGDRPSGSTLSGHLVFGELAARAEDVRYIKLVRAAADLGFDESGNAKAQMPFHNEMSDAVFMGTPILVQAGRLTGERRYYQMADRHRRFMLKLNLREDGLHQHSPLDPAKTAWGRGNGFPALGLALALSEMPRHGLEAKRGDAPIRDDMLASYRAHIAAMVKHQDEMGMWHQVVDRPESYREFTVTCMTTFAIVRGLREGWLDKKQYEPVVHRAWHAISRRIGPDGFLSDVCQGTGKQKSYRDYLDRGAILGKDDRGGAMALMVSTEIAYAQREGALSRSP